MNQKSILSLCLIAMSIAIGFASNPTAVAQKFSTNSRLILGTESNRSASVRLGDLDSDGDIDAVVANGRHWPQQNYLFINDGRSRFPIMRPLGTDRCTTYACELADLDSDGDLDIATGNDMTVGKIFLNDGKANFTEHESFGSPASVRSLTLADIDSDGDVDILATVRGAKNQIYLNDGKASFKQGATFGVAGDSTIDVEVADINGDGHQDLVLANRDSQPNAWVLNNGKTEFTKRIEFGVTDSQSRAIAVGDLNGDKHLDWVVGNIAQKSCIFLGDGTGAAIQRIEFGSTARRTYCLSIADVDADGDLDIVTGNAGQANEVFLNGGDATKFQSMKFGAENHATYGLSVADLNGDKLPDIVVANSDAPNSVFLNRRVQRSNRPKKASTPNRSPKLNVAELQTKASTTSDWPSFRGANREGVAEGHSLPLAWNADPSGETQTGVLWEATVPGLGHSSPVVAGNKLFLLTAVATDGNAPLQVKAGGKPTAADDNGIQEWMVLCYDKSSGKELWRRTAHKGKPQATRHSKATHANTSVSIEGDKLLAFFGSEGLYCYDLDGNLNWKRDLGIINISKYGIGWGFASSPAIRGDRIAIVCDDPTDPYVAVLRLSDGKELWRKSRKGICERSWGTPLIHEQDGVTQAVVNGWPWIVSYDMSDGEVLWRIKGGGDNPVPSPFASNGWLYITNAHGGPAPIYVLKPDAKGDLGDDDSSVVWSSGKGGCYMSTPVVYRDHLYLGNSNGIVRCFHAKTGERIFESRLGRGAGVIASLVAGDGKVYCPSENGTVYVLAADDELNILSQNQMGEPVLASPAISEGVIFLRTTKRLVAVGDAS